MIDDFPFTVDDPEKKCQARTRPTDEGTPSAIPSEPNQMATEVKAEPIQLDLKI